MADERKVTNTDDTKKILKELKEIKSSLKDSSYWNVKAYSIAVMALGITTVSLGFTALFGMSGNLHISITPISIISIILMVLGVVSVCWGVFHWFKH